MRYDRRTLAGLLAFVGALECLLAMLVAEGTRPEYSISTNYISDLGVGTTALLFNGSVVILGILVLLSGYLYHADHRKLWITAPFLLAGIGPIGVGLFPETTGAPHTVFAFVSFVFGSLLAIFITSRTRPPFRYVSLGLGVLGLAAVGLFASGTTLGIGIGGTERMIADPVLFWFIAFGAYLMASEEPRPTTATPPIRG